MIEVIAYKCEYCGKLFNRKINAEKHENIFCFYSPKSRSCGTCKHFIFHEQIEEYERLRYCELGFDQIINEYSDVEMIKYQKNCNAWELKEEIE